MGHPLVDEFARISGLSNCQPHFFNRCQRTFREELNPVWDAHEALVRENADLKAQVAALEAQLVEAQKKRRRAESAEVGA